MYYYHNKTTFNNCLLGGHWIVRVYLFHFRKVILGDYNLSENPDCEKQGYRKLCAPPKIVRNIEKTIVHENYATDPSNNIALIRMDEIVPLHSEDASISTR